MIAVICMVVGFVLLVALAIFSACDVGAIADEADEAANDGSGPVDGGAV